MACIIQVDYDAPLFGPLEFVETTIILTDKRKTFQFKRKHPQNQKLVHDPMSKDRNSLSVVFLGNFFNNIKSPVENLSERFSSRGPDSMGCGYPTIVFLWPSTGHNLIFQACPLPVVEIFQSLVNYCLDFM